MLETDQAWEVFEKLEDCYFSTSRKTLPALPATLHETSPMHSANKSNMPSGT